MFLQSVTLRGFKSFADKTTLAFEPGITVVVGPNGAGKSNVVDALTWVLGTHSAKTLRGGQMSDVIFAGSPSRPGLGRAEVEIRIDNSSGALPIEFSEVTVSRAMYASGENTYAINGVTCRLLDVAELLSDTGLGRENHTIVGQGRLDAVLNARPDERRTFIEEAAGILKHRRRKERALRKLDQMQDHVERLADLLRELRRQMRPLERQAEAAARSAELRTRRDEVVLVRTLREFDRLSRRLEDLQRADDQLQATAAANTAQVDQSRSAERDLEQRLAADQPRTRQAAQTHVLLSTATERLRGLSGRIDERRQGLFEAAEEPVAGRDPGSLRDEANRCEEDLTALDADLTSAQATLDERTRERAAAEQARRAHEQAVVAEARRRAAARERQLRWEGQVSALQSALSQAAGEEGRLAAQISGLAERRRGLSDDVEHARGEIQRLDAAAPGLAARLAEAERHLTRRTDIADDLEMAERELERERASLQARADALRATAASAHDGVTAMVDAADAGKLSGIRGPLLSEIEVTEGTGAAVALALGDLGDAVVVDTSDAARAGVGFARQASGRVLLLAGTAAAAPRHTGRDDDVAAAGGQPLMDCLNAPAGVRNALSWALRDVYLVPHLTAAADCAGRHPECWFVTADGESAGARGWAGGHAPEPTAVLALAGAEEAERRLHAVAEELSVVHRQLIEADAQRDRARDEVDAATVLLQESDGRITAAAERLRRLEAELSRCESELDERRTQAAQLADGMARRRAELAELRARGSDAGAVDDGDAGPDVEAERLDDVVAGAREAEVQARLELRSVQNREAEIRRRIDALRSEADAVERELAAREERRRARVAAVSRCDELLAITRAALNRAIASLSAAEQARTAAESEQAGRREELGAVRARLRELETTHAELTQQRHSSALARQELEAAVAGVRQTLQDLRQDEDPDELLRSARSRHPDRASADDGDADVFPLDGGPERDAELEAAQRRLERQLGLLGDVNPLAHIEFERLRERHTFLESQLDDLRASRKDLLEVVDAVDARIRDVFAEAFADVAAAFERIFPRLFPGGDGKLVLTEPDDLLSAGVDVEARPAGKRVKRLSLLSGGERSLTALAVMFAIFAARPSPFYVLDEVEAALDDVNLQRFLDVVAEFRGSSQLILVTHQRRTMEIADLLYGVTMQGTGVSTVISQRSAELVPSA